jgi:hypothetical protein
LACVNEGRPVSSLTERRWVGTPTYPELLAFSRLLVELVLDPLEVALDGGLCAVKPAEECARLLLALLAVDLTRPSESLLVGQRERLEPAIAATGEQALETVDGLGQAERGEPGSDLCLGLVTRIRLSTGELGLLLRVD